MIKKIKIVRNRFSTFLLAGLMLCLSGLSSCKVTDDVEEIIKKTGKIIEDGVEIIVDGVTIFIELATDLVIDVSAEGFTFVKGVYDAIREGEFCSLLSLTSEVTSSLTSEVTSKGVSFLYSNVGADLIDVINVNIRMSTINDIECFTIDLIEGPSKLLESSCNVAIEVVENFNFNNRREDIVGAPLAILLEHANVMYEGNAMSIPQEIKERMRCHFSSKVLAEAEYAVSDICFNLDIATATNELFQNELFQHKISQSTNHAITIGNIIVFQKEPELTDYVNSSDFYEFWAHELTHVEQYYENGELNYAKFAHSYTSDLYGNTIEGNKIQLEKDAEDKANTVSQNLCPVQPKFSSTPYEFSVAVGATDGATVGTVSAMDPNEDRLTYSLSGEGSNHFAITGGTFAITGGTNEVSGKEVSIVVAEGADLPSLTSPVEFTIKVTDGLFPNDAPVKIMITN